MERFFSENQIQFHFPFKNFPLEVRTILESSELEKIKTEMEKKHGFDYGDKSQLLAANGFLESSGFWCGDQEKSVLPNIALHNESFPLENVLEKRS